MPVYKCLTHNFYAEVDEVAKTVRYSKTEWGSGVNCQLLKAKFFEGSVNGCEIRKE